jgi:hypothetical protein
VFEQQDKLLEAIDAYNKALIIQPRYKLDNKAHQKAEQYNSPK